MKTLMMLILMSLFLASCGGAALVEDNNGSGQSNATKVYTGKVI